MHLAQAHKQTDVKYDNNGKLEVMFMVSNNPVLVLDLGEHNEKALEVLEFKITRNPLNLRSHVQRIYLYRQLKNGNALYGALLDLFISLKNKGFDVRQRLLFESKHRLETHYFQVLYNALGAGIRASDAVPPSQYSLLSQGLTGTNNLLTSNSKSSEERYPRDPRQEAQEYLEYGDIDEARKLLEIAVLKEPWRKELHNDLLEIYRATRDASHCDDMYRQLSDKYIPDHHAWVQTAEHIHQAVGAI